MKRLHSGSALRTNDPIEAEFATLFEVARRYMLGADFWRFALSLRPNVWVESSHGRLYRLAFALTPQDEWLAGALVDSGLELRVGVELDGHDSDERTPQVIMRNQRDRDLAALRWRILRFSGSEVRRDPMAVAVEAIMRGADALDEAKALLHGPGSRGVGRLAIR